MPGYDNSFHRNADEKIKEAIARGEFDNLPGKGKRCASTIQIVRPSQSKAETRPKLHPALLSLSAMISQYFTHSGFTAVFLAEFLKPAIAPKLVEIRIQSKQSRCC
jgi:DnaJ-like protein